MSLSFNIARTSKVNKLFVRPCVVLSNDCHKGCNCVSGISSFIDWISLSDAGHYNTCLRTKAKGPHCTQVVVSILASVSAATDYIHCIPKKNLRKE